MDRTLVEEKLDALHYCVQRLRSKCPGDDRRLYEDPDLQDIIALNLARAVQLSVDIAAHLLAAQGGPAPHTMADAFGRLQEGGILDQETADRMKKAVGFRNIAVHAYEKIDWGIVAEICRRHLADFESFAAAINCALDREYHD